MYNPYAVLGVRANSSKDSIKAVYRELCKTVHPDIPKTGNAQKFIEITKAWKVIEENHIDGGFAGYMWRHTNLFNIHKEESK